jgi:hypothetical protein
LNEKEHKTKLENKILELEQQIKILNVKLNHQEHEFKEVTINKKKLSPKEKKIYEFYETLDKTINQQEFSLICDIEIMTLRTMISRIRKKGYPMKFI